MNVRMDGWKAIENDNLLCLELCLILLCREPIVTSFVRPLFLFSPNYDRIIFELFIANTIFGYHFEALAINNCLDAVVKPFFIIDCF